MNSLIVRPVGSVVEVTLNCEATLNALSLDMVEQLLALLPQWAADDSVQAVLFRGAGERAFSAGGDIQQLYRQMTQGDYAACARFFEREYLLDASLQRFAKPLVAWGDGFVMGGGMGVFQGCRHRIVTERTRMAMPETRIGFVPDVGAGHFLNHRPDRLGWVCGLIGGQFYAHDAVFLRLADCIAPSNRYEELRDLLSNTASADCADALQNWSRALQPPDCEEPLLQKHAGALVEALSNSTDAPSFLAQFSGVVEAGGDDAARLEKFARGVESASPLAQQLTWLHLQRSRGQHLTTVLQWEYDLVNKLCRHGEFREGVRAAIIDRDGSAQWQQDNSHQPHWMQLSEGMISLDTGEVPA